MMGFFFFRPGSTERLIPPPRDAQQKTVWIGLQGTEPMNEYILEASIKRHYRFMKTIKHVFHQMKEVTGNLLAKLTKTFSRSESLATNSRERDLTVQALLEAVDTIRAEKKALDKIIEKMEHQSIKEPVKIVLEVGGRTIDEAKMLLVKAMRFEDSPTTSTGSGETDLL